MQPQQITKAIFLPLFGAVSQVRKPQTIDLRTAHRLCVNELGTQRNPTIEQLKKYLLKNGLQLDPRDYLREMYAEGVKNEN